MSPKTERVGAALPPGVLRDPGDNPREPSVSEKFYKALYFYLFLWFFSLPPSLLAQMNSREVFAPGAAEEERLQQPEDRGSSLPSA